MESVRKSFAAAFLSFSLFVMPVNASDLGMTPNHVFGLWTSINGLLPILAPEERIALSMRNLSTATFADKKPSDVLALVIDFSKQLNGLLIQNKLPELEIDHITDHETVTPSDVFLDSGRVLDSLVLIVIKNTDSSELISNHYVDHNFSNKIPDDVYSLVDLASRQLKMLVAKRTTASDS